MAATTNESRSKRARDGVPSHRRPDDEALRLAEAVRQQVRARIEVVLPRLIKARLMNLLS
jgi:hypothetical protein